MIEFYVKTKGIMTAMNLNKNTNMMIDIKHIPKQTINKSASSSWISHTIPYPTKMLLIGTNSDNHLDVKSTYYVSIDAYGNLDGIYGNSNGATDSSYANNVSQYDENGNSSGTTTEQDTVVLDKLTLEVDIANKKFRFYNSGTTNLTNVEFTVIIIGHQYASISSTTKILAGADNSIKEINTEIETANIIDIGLFAKKISANTSETITFPFNATKVLILEPASQTSSHLASKFSRLRTSGNFDTNEYSSDNRFASSTSTSLYLSDIVPSATQVSDPNERSLYSRGLKINNNTTGAKTVRFIYFIMSTLPDPNVLC